MTIKTHSIKKSENYISLVIEKHESSIGILRKVLHDLRFNNIETLVLLSPLGTPENNYSERKYSDKIYTDKHFSLNKDNLHIEIFFEYKKILISLFSKDPLPSHISSILSKYFKL